MGIHHCFTSPRFFTLLVREYQGQRWRLGRWFQKCLLSACITEFTVPWRLVVLQCLDHPINFSTCAGVICQKFTTLKLCVWLFLTNICDYLNMLQLQQSIQKTGTLSPLFSVSLGEYCQTMYHVTPNWPILQIVWRKKDEGCPFLLQLWKVTTKTKQTKAGRWDIHVIYISQLIIIC